MVKYCVLDTETTGLPTRKSYDDYFPYTDFEKYKKSRIVSIAWVVYEDLVKINQGYFVIKPVDFKIDNKSKATEINGITQEIAESHGVLLEVVFAKLEKDLDKANVLVAHNLAFDKNIILAEASHLDNLNLVRKIVHMTEYCTMKMGKNVTCLSSKFNKRDYKYPKLIELYFYFFRTNFPNAHHAMGDVIACLACYQKLNSLL